MRTPLALLALILLLPGVQATSGSREIEALHVKASPSLVQVELVGLWYASDSLEFRLHLDAEYGDADGQAEDAEANVFLGERRHTPRFSDADCRGDFQWITMDGQAPTGVVSLSTRFEGLEGVAASLTRIRQIDTWTLAFQPANATHGLLAIAPGDVPLSFSDLSCYTPKDNLAHGTLRFYACCGSYWGAEDYTVEALPPFHVEADGIQPDRFQPLWKESRWESNAATRRDVRNATISFPLLHGDASLPSSNAAPATLPPGSGGTAAWGILASFLIVAFAAKALRVTPAIALFARVPKERALDHPARDTLMALVRAEPGICEADLVRRSGLGRGRVGYHLRILENHRLVRRVPSPYRVGFAPADAPPRLRPAPCGPESDVLEIVAATPGLSQSDVMDQWTAPRHRASHHLRRLVRLGWILQRREGRRIRYYVKP